ncbi:MAG: threonine--tRNA ligase [Acidobacteria bacterium RBG_16_70_10]|nr:MAG: threonine--tRNA ligase [Acidobacteria bacterium RBG_16_70_10]
MSSASPVDSFDATGPSGETKPADSPIEIYRHSSAHLLAAAVTELFPDAQCGIGPPTADGFFYDFLVSRPFTPEDLEAIEKRMAEIAKQDRPIEKKLIPKREALDLFASKGQALKCELIREKAGDVVQCYTMGGFIDFCLGPHLPSTGHIKAFKLNPSPAAAYWKGREGNPSMQRIYGYAFFTKEELDRHLFRLEEAKRRDHRKLGRELDLFSIAEETGAGLVLWHPKGGFIRKQIEDFWRDEHLAGGYDIVFSPHIAKLDLWKTSGHTEYYRANMYSPIEMENVEYQLKPMNCPFHITIYRSKLRSYRELPFRWAELGTVYRFERSGVLHGLLRVRGFTQDDAHIFCRPDQLETEILRVLDFVVHVLRAFGFDRYDIFLSTKPETASGTDEQWGVGTAALRKALETRGLGYQVDPGEGVFYGPKIDIKIKDSLDRAWQCSTIQVDFHNPERFRLEYIGEDGRAHPPVMVHRALLGSLERFFGVLIEHYGGAFPLWLAPVQAVVLPVAERHHAYSREVAEKLRALGLRVHVDDRSEKTGYKIREAQVQKVPYMLVVGDREVAATTVSVRHRQAGDLGPRPVEEFGARVARLAAERALAEEASPQAAGGAP